ncbi:MAG: cytochrome c1 [Betaproteobacteria bacterium]|nr:cytochrome c1 [Betaproteobacteria bacterium]
MIARLSVLFLALAVVAAHAAAQTTPLLSPPAAFDRATIRRGAQWFAQYCLSCHSVKWIRYDRLTRDLGFSKDAVRQELMFPGGAHFAQGMVPTLSARDAAAWFGVAPPDLTLEARLRGGAWIYTYLRSFYFDPTRPSGWNNHLFPDAAMPNVLAPISGIRDAKGRLIQRGRLTPRQVNQVIGAITVWLEYTSDPSKLERERLGPYVIGFALLLSVVAYLMKRAYWREVS